MISPPTKMVSYNPEYLTQFVNSLSEKTFETLEETVKAKKMRMGSSIGLMHKC